MWAFCGDLCAAGVVNVQRGDVATDAPHEKQTGGPAWIFLVMLASAVSTICQPLLAPAGYL